MFECQPPELLGPDRLLSLRGELGEDVLDHDDLQFRLLLGDQIRRLVDEAGVFEVPVVQGDVAEPRALELQDVLEHIHEGGRPKRDGPWEVLPWSGPILRRAANFRTRWRRLSTVGQQGRGGQALHMRRRSLCYRLERIAKLLDVDLND